MLLLKTDNFIYWLILNILIGSFTSILFPYLMVTFSMKSSSPEKTAQLSGLAQTGGYVFAALGPILFGSSQQIFHSWTPGILILLVVALFMSMALYQVEKSDIILILCYVLIIRKMIRVRGRSDFLLRYHGQAFHSKCLLVHKCYLLEHRNVVSR